MAQRYGQNENIYVFRLMLPWVVLHFVLSSLFYAAVILIVRSYDLRTEFVELITVSGYLSVGIVITLFGKCT